MGSVISIRPLSELRLQDLSDFPLLLPPNIKLWTIFMIVHRVADWFVFDGFLHLEKNVFIKNTTPTQTITVMLMF